MREEQSSDRDEGIDDDLLFVVEDLVDEPAQKSPRAPAPRPAARAPARRPDPRAERVARPPQEVRVIIGSKKPRNPLYGKLARHGFVLLATALLVVLVPSGLTLLERVPWLRRAKVDAPVAQPAVVAKRPTPAVTKPTEVSPVLSSALEPATDTSEPASGQGVTPTLAEAASSELPTASAASAEQRPAVDQQPTAAAKTTANPNEQTIEEFVAQLNNDQRSSLEAGTGDEQASEAASTRNHDTIVELKNGSHFRGTVKKMTEDQVILAYAHGQYTFARADLLRIIPPGSREYLPLETFPEAVVRLRGGGRFRAHVLKDTDDAIVLGYSAGKLTFPRREVEAIEYAKPDDAPFRAELPKFDFPEPARDESAPPGAEAPQPTPEASVPEGKG